MTNALLCNLNFACQCALCSRAHAAMPISSSPEGETSRCQAVPARRRVTVRSTCSTKPLMTCWQCATAPCPEVRYMTITRHVKYNISDAIATYLRAQALWSAAVVQQDASEATLGLEGHLRGQLLLCLSCCAPISGHEALSLAPKLTSTHLLSSAHAAAISLRAAFWHGNHLSRCWR